MKKILLYIACICCLLVSCSKDNDLEELSFRKNELAQTTWSGQQLFYDNDDNVSFTEKFVIEFHEEPTAWYIAKGETSTDKFSFKYGLNGKVLYATSGIPGYWTLIEKKKRHMVFQAYLPEKSVLILDKEY